MIDDILAPIVAGPAPARRLSSKTNISEFLLYSHSFKARAAAQRSLERRKSEDEAPRLAAEIPTLRSARIEVVELTSNGSTMYVKHVVVARAPMLFIISCGDQNCQDGGHDITSDVMRALRQHQEHAEGESSCSGMTGSAPCRRSIRFTLTAGYADQAPA